MTYTSESEGEILDSPKATTALSSAQTTSVNRRLRDAFSPDRSPASPPPFVRAPRNDNRDRSRSPYRAPRGEKRRREDERSSRFPDSRRFQSRYDDRSSVSEAGRRTGLYEDSYGNDVRLQYDERDDRDRYRDKRSRRDSRDYGNSNQARNGGRRRSDDQSVSEVGRRPLEKAAEYGNSQSRQESKSVRFLNNDGYVCTRTRVVTSNFTMDKAILTDFSSSAAFSDEVENAAQTAPPVDEVLTIEERRKRREAIKAKYKTQNKPLLVQALEGGATSNDMESPRSERSGMSSFQVVANVADLAGLVSPVVSSPRTPLHDSAAASPEAVSVVSDTELANANVTESLEGDMEEPSAADYDPTMDMEQDHLRDRRHHGQDIPAVSYDETIPDKQEVLLPQEVVQAPVKAEVVQNKADDMFADPDEDDMFAPAAPENLSLVDGPSKAVLIPEIKELDQSLLDNWDDHEGYYKIILGELLDGRYAVQANLGKGMFSNVLRAADITTNDLVAIKIIRNNETMIKAGTKEMEILEKLASADPDDKKHVIRLIRSFTHKGHLCMVFEHLSINLREVLKKFGRDVGINIKAVRSYAQQMFLGLSLLRKCNILHADLKPDNVLVNENRSMLKICDLGSAADASENDITPYLVSRFYRAPEIILGIPYDFAIDMWSIGCTLFELYTGKILFTGRTNNQMLRSIMECRGKFSLKMLKKAEFGAVHFDEVDLNFRSLEQDRITGKDITRLINFTKPTRDLKSRLLAAGSGRKGMLDAEVKEVNLFADLLDRCLALNPEKRITPLEALKHPFIMRTNGLVKP